MVKGVRALRRRFAKVPQNVKDEAVVVLERYANRIVIDMKNLVPVKEGDLRDSIGWTWGEAPAGSLTIGKVFGNQFGKIKITIYAGNKKTIVTNKAGIEFQNARIQEFGANATPFFFPPYRANRGAVKSALTRAVRKGFKKS
jgi:bacteriophage HK97-gp10 putative tail-component